MSGEELLWFWLSVPTGAVLVVVGLILWLKSRKSPALKNKTTAGIICLVAGVLVILTYLKNTLL